MQPLPKRPHSDVTDGYEMAGLCKGDLGSYDDVADAINKRHQDKIEIAKEALREVKASICVVHYMPHPETNEEVRTRVCTVADKAIAKLEGKE